MKMQPKPKGVMYYDWIKENLPPGSKVGIDPNIVPGGPFITRQKMFAESQIELLPVAGLVD